MAKMMEALEAAAKKVLDHGVANAADWPIELRKPHRWYVDRVRELVDTEHDVVLELHPPDDDDPEDIANGLVLEMDLERNTADEVQVRLRLATVAHNIQLEFNKATAGAVEEARKEVARREAEAEAKREALAKVLAERRDQLLNEFISEKGRIRIRGYKRWRPVTVEARETGDGYEPYFLYVYDRHGYSEHFGKHIQAFEIKVGSRFRNVWDDGTDDLNDWDAKDIKTSQPYDGELA